MNSPEDAERQGQPVGLRRPQAQLTFMYVADAMESALDHLANSENVRGMDWIRETLDHIASEAKGEAAAVRSLAGYRPIFECDSKLHEVRRTVLEKRAIREGWLVSWTDDGAATLDMGWGLISVDRCDNWTAPSAAADSFFCGHGLTSFLAYLDGEHIVETTAKVSRWLDRREQTK